MQHTPNMTTVSSSETSCFSTTLDDPVSMTSQRSESREINLNLSVKSREKLSRFLLFLKLLLKCFFIMTHRR